MDIDREKYLTEQVLRLTAENKALTKKMLEQSGKEPLFEKLFLATVSAAHVDEAKCWIVVDFWALRETEHGAEALKRFRANAPAEARRSRSLQPDVGTQKGDA
jgi:hypothetical protein